MPMFILSDATGIGSDDIDTLQAFVDLVIIANDDGVGMDDPAGGMQQVTYVPTVAGIPQTRLDALVNTTFTPDYGSGPQQVDIIVIPGLSGFTLDDGTSFANNGTALPPASSGLPGSGLNTTENCLVIYDTEQNICVARDGTGGDIDLSISNPVVLYHEFSHAFRIVNNTLLTLGGGCNPSSPEENAAITDENDLRTQIANRQGETPELRDPGIHCGQVGCDSGCCIIATVASQSLNSRQVQSLRSVRDHFVRSTETGHAFFEIFFRDYYSFSPQVCTLMAGHPGLSRQILDGFVDPLLVFWKIMILRSQPGFPEAELGRVFFEMHPDREQAKARRQALQATTAYWQGSGLEVGGLAAQLIGILTERAWPSRHMQWGLIEPVEIYSGTLGLFLAESDPELLGAHIRRTLDNWAAEVPIPDVWAALSTGVARQELKVWDNALLKSSVNRHRFRQRLGERFPDITAIQAVATATFETTGDADGQR